MSSFLNQHSASQRGFTLLEVMIALTVYAVAAVGLLTVISQGTFSATRLEEKTLAHWVAQNKMVEMRQLKQAPNVGVQDSKVDMAERNWHLETEIENTALPQMLRIEIRVGLKPGNSKSGDIRLVNRLIGFINKPV